MRTQWLVAFALALPVAVIFARTGAPAELRASHAAAQASGNVVVVVVNGRAITEADVTVRMKSDVHTPTATADRRKAAIEALVVQELLAQRAHEIGLDQDPKLAEEAAEADAQLAAFKRRRLADLFVEREIVSKVDTSDAEARKYFDDNASRIKSEVHVLQIFRRNKQAIDAARAAIASGKRFEDVAGMGYMQVPPGGHAPWDVGFVKYLQLPEQVRDVAMNLKPGEVSEVISAPNDRYWIVKLVERRDDPTMTFEMARASILDALRMSKIDARRAEIERGLRAQAKVELKGNQ